MEWKWNINRETEILSDHFSIIIEVKGKELNVNGRMVAGNKGWRKDTFEEKYFEEALLVGLWPS